MIAPLLAMLATLILGGAAQGWAAAPTLQPVFPAENPNLLFVEGEDAVSTNYAREPTLNFGTSGYRALQLDRSTGIQGIGSFYADYAFNVPSEGTWELWYGGTPPGPRDELYPSYASPFQLTLDAEKPRPVYRENVKVAGNYSPAFYWNLVGDLALAAGRHQIRFEVTEKRRIDGRYHFYLDCFFLVKKQDGKRVVAEPLPAVFPATMDEKGGDVPFLSIDDYLIKIRDNPGKTGPLVDLSLVYTLIGDSLGALKYLNQAMLLAPRDVEIALLVAKNRVWKGDLAAGLKKYREILQIDPRHRELWLEAGKVAAWSGRYDESIGFFRDGLAAFPLDADLTINLGLTLVWAGRGQEAEAVFREAQAQAGGDAGKLKAMGRVYRINGYPDRAIQAYTAATNADPADLESHLLLIATLSSAGKTAEADAARARISATFVDSPRLAAYLEDFKQTEGLKGAVMDEYRGKLAANPDNLVLRQILAQAYFWNGLKTRAIEEYRHILDNHAYLAVRDMEQGSAAVPRLLDQGYLLADWFTRFPAIAKAQRDALAAQQQKLAKASEASRDAETTALAALAAAARELSARFASSKSLAASHAEATAAEQQKDAEAEDAFARAIKGGTWRFDKAALLAELGKDVQDNSLARLVNAKLYLMDRQNAQAQSLLANQPMGVGVRYTYAQSLLWAGKPKEGRAVIAELAADKGSAVLPAYFDDMAGLARSLSGPADPARMRRPRRRLTRWLKLRPRPRSSPASIARRRSNGIRSPKPWRSSIPYTVTPWCAPSTPSRSPWRRSATSSGTTSSRRSRRPSTTPSPSSPGCSRWIPRTCWRPSGWARSTSGSGIGSPRWTRSRPSTTPTPTTRMWRRCTTPSRGSTRNPSAPWPRTSRIPSACNGTRR
jgi:Tfp pilus assembly protein PilF